ncbi:MAG: HD domain-containing protein [Lachnospiraceae bacterium]|nr:HD domain-containing protein [Lachnospiraceae bacterium]
MNEQIIDEAIEYVKKVFENDYSGHDFFHTFRVYKMAATIAKQERADMMIVQLAALLHDVDDRKLSPETYANKDKAVDFLRKHNVPKETIKTICDIIDAVSFMGVDSVVPKSIEGKCVQDADRLDAIGAIGIARAFTYGGNHNRAIYNPDIPFKEKMTKEEYQNNISTTINHFYEKLFQLSERMNTDTAKAIAKERDSYMRAYISEFLAEWEGIR